MRAGPKAVVGLGRPVSLRSFTPNTGVGVVGPYPAPSGFAWSAIMDGLSFVFDGSNQVVELQRIY